MKITRITTYPVRVPLKPEFKMISALGQYEVSKYVIVRVETDADIDGVGEASITACWSGETVWGTAAIIDNMFAPALIGHDPYDIKGLDAKLDQIAYGNWFAKSAIENACWDIQGKDQGKPVYELIGGPARSNTIKCRFSMGAYDPERAYNRAKELISFGFTTIKVKVGTNLDKDIERIKTVRDAIGPEYEMVMDANCGFDAPTAIKMAEAVEDCNVALFEQPTTRGDYEALAKVRKAITPKVMADDICFDLADARECLRHEACDVISVYPGKNGGLRKSLEIVKLAEEFGVVCSIGSNLEWDIASAPMCHLCVGAENMQVETYPGDIMGPAYHQVRLVEDPLVIDFPTITIPDKPGIGVTPDWTMIEEHTMKTLLGGATMGLY
ncbi:MAG: muconate cycloisomerase [Planctomyces sp.]|nr:muconate cycloisomerase [Planctomyces sp.]